MVPVPRSHDPLAADWIAALLIGCVVVLAIINRTAPRTWRILGQATFRLRLGSQTLREDVDLQDRNFLGLLLVAVLAIAMLGWQLLVIHGGAVHTTYLTLVAGVAVVLLVQGLLPRLVAGLLHVDAGSSEYLYTGSLLYALTGILLLPLVTVAAYNVDWRDGLLLSGGVLLGLTVLYRWFRGAWIGMGEGLSPGYIILYLCAAEIVPVLLAIHALR